MTPQEKAQLIKEIVDIVMRMLKVSHPNDYTGNVDATPRP